MRTCEADRGGAAASVRGVSKPTIQESTLIITSNIRHTGHVPIDDRPRLRRLRALAAVLIAVAALIGGVLSATPATAQPIAGAPRAALTADLSTFNPGYIISDGQFFNASSMTQAQIQAFIQSKAPSCRSGYTCLKDWVDTSRTVAADAMCGAYQGGYSESASQIIFKVAQACGINPQVILVTLQKEQGLVTSTAPSTWAYTVAMGQGCPDTSACNTLYYGFFNQVYGAAWQFKRYANPPGTSQYFTWYAPGQTWNVLYNPNRGCGSAPVYIQNQATADLYYYTPYQPNPAALSAGYGTGDGCSSYGNRNFFNYYSDWFGSTVANVCSVPVASQLTPSAAIFVAGPGATFGSVAPSPWCGAAAVALPQNVALASTATYQDWTQLDVGGTLAWVQTASLIPVGSTAAPTYSLDDTHNVLALAGDGTVWAYPFSTVGRWGIAQSVLTGSGLKSILGVGDFYGDGHRALLGIDAAGKVWMYRGDGTRFSAPTQLPVDWSTSRLITAAGDFDGDGIPDVFTVEASGALLLWRGNGAGGFRAPIAVGQGWGGMDAIVGGADFSGDGKPDLIARTAAGGLYLYSGNGRGGWLGATQIGQGWGGFTALLTAGDFTGDGRADLIGRDSNGNLQLYRGTGSGLAYMAQIGYGWSGMTSLSGAGLGVGVAAPRNLAAGAGTPGHPDVLTVKDGQLIAYHGDGKGSWTGSSVLDPNWPAGARLVTMGDFSTGLGRRDIGRIESDGTFSLLTRNADGSLGKATVIGNGWSSMTAVVGGADFDGDGFPDVIARDAGGALWLYRGNGAGGWIGTATQIGYGWNGFDTILYVGDFNGDGTGALVARVAATGALWLYPLNGQGGWGAARQIGYGWGGLTGLAAPGDFDGTGGPDVLGRLANGDLVMFRGDGRGGWAGTRTVGWGWQVFSQLQ